MNRVAKIFTDYNEYHRAEQIAGNSPYWGLTFCVGTWSAGGDRMGNNVFEMIRDFGSRGKIFAGDNGLLRAGTAYYLAYTRASLQQAREEAG
jgi:hypothetical protein